MEVSDPYLTRLIDLWSPPSTRHHTGEVIGFERIEQQIGLALPASYKQLVHTYGQGVWFETVLVLNPFYAWLQDLEPLYSPQHGRGVRTWCDGLREMRKESPENFIHPIYPEAGGIFPYALFFGIRGTLYWLTSGHPDGWPSLFDLGDGTFQQEWERFDMPITELFWRLAAGDKAVKGTALDAILSGFRSTVFRAIRW